VSDMRHLQFLSDVVTADVAHIMKREQTYQGSWKKRGGVGAFMMAARKWDRLEVMLSTAIEGCPSLYEIFDYIAFDPDGGDGTVLEQIRDLRHYLLLIESEMVARGIVKVEHPDLYTMMALHRGVSREQAKKDVYEDFYSAGRQTQSADVKTPVRVTETTERVGNVSQTQRIEEYAPPPATPEAGSHHATLTPFAVALGWRDKHAMQPGGLREDVFDRFYRRVSPGTWVLEPFVDCSSMIDVPLELGAHYTWTENPAIPERRPMVRGYLLRIDHVPADARDWFPDMSLEVNGFELDHLQPWQRILYNWVGSGEDKYRLRDTGWHLESTS
jgi:hypothetical protein